MRNILVAMLALFVLIAVPAEALDMKTWTKDVMKKVRKEQRYPRSAMNREIEGQAKVKLTIDAGGNILNSEITQKTGAAVLDREIPKLVQRLNPLPALPAGKDSLTFTLPVTWALR